MANQIVLSREFGASSADTISQIVDLYSKHARSLETFNINACKRGDDLERELAEAKTEIENLVWNLAGCDTLAMGYAKPGDFSKELARPALYSVSKLATDRNRLMELVKAQDEYAVLLTAELNDVVPLAAIHNWKSSRVDDGEKARARIAALRTS